MSYRGEYLEKHYPYKDLQIPVSQFTGEGSYYLNFLSDRKKNFFLSLGLSALAGYETSNWGDKLLPDGSMLTNKDGGVYGGALTLELESYITDRVVFLIKRTGKMPVRFFCRKVPHTVRRGAEIYNVINYLLYIMYMRNVIYKMLIGGYMVAALLLVSACNDNVDIQQSYPFTVETMPVPKKLKVGETAEIRCQLHRDGRYEETKYFIRYFQPDGAGC